jgi:hypothetical protein
MIFSSATERRDDFSRAAWIDEADCFSLAQLEVEGYGALVAAPGLELDRIALVQILELDARREAAAMEKNIIAAVVGNDESKALISDNFFYRSGHITDTPFFLSKPRVSYPVFPKPARTSTRS